MKTSIALGSLFLAISAGIWGSSSGPVAFLGFEVYEPPQFRLRCGMRNCVNAELFAIELRRNRDKAGFHAIYSRLSSEAKGFIDDAETLDFSKDLSAERAEQLWKLDKELRSMLLHRSLFPLDRLPEETFQFIAKPNPAELENWSLPQIQRMNYLLLKGLVPKAFPPLEGEPYQTSVHIDYPGEPVVLVLVSSSSNHWVVTTEAQTQIERVVLIGLSLQDPQSCSVANLKPRPVVESIVNPKLWDPASRPRKPGAGSPDISSNQIFQTQFIQDHLRKKHGIDRIAHSDFQYHYRSDKKVYLIPQPAK